MLTDVNLPTVLSKEKPLSTYLPSKVLKAIGQFLCFWEAHDIVQDRLYGKMWIVCNFFPWSLYLAYNGGIPPTLIITFERDGITPIMRSIINDDLDMYKLIRNTHDTHDVPFKSYGGIDVYQTAAIINKHLGHSNIHNYLLQKHKRGTLEGSYRDIFFE
jgi:hypothetical protein